MTDRYPPDYQQNDYKLKAADKAALWIAGVAIVVRAGMQWAPHDPGAMIDYAWVTNFAVIVAGWLSIRSRVGDTAKSAEVVQAQTNGGLERRIETIVRRVLDDHDREVHGISQDDRKDK